MMEWVIIVNAVALAAASLLACAMRGFRHPVESLVMTYLLGRYVLYTALWALDTYWVVRGLIVMTAIYLAWLFEDSVPRFKHFRLITYACVITPIWWAVWIDRIMWEAGLTYSLTTLLLIASSRYPAEAILLTAWGLMFSSDVRELIVLFWLNWDIHWPNIITTEELLIWLTLTYILYRRGVIGVRSRGWVIAGLTAVGTANVYHIPAIATTIHANPHIAVATVIAVRLAPTILIYGLLKPPRVLN